jgi:hypothetical protein
MGAIELRLEKNPPRRERFRMRRAPLGSLFANRVEPLWALSKDVAPQSGRVRRHLESPLDISMGTW